VPHLRVHGKGNKTRYIPLHASTQELLNDYLDDARHAADTEGVLFRPVSNNRTGKLDDTITPDGVYKLVRRYALALGLKIAAHALRAVRITGFDGHEARKLNAAGTHEITSAGGQDTEEADCESDDP
jgi:integrase/recombinase XerD